MKRLRQAAGAMVAGLVGSEQFERLMRTAPVASLISAVGAGMVCWGFRDAPRTNALTTWLTLFVLVGAWRALLGLAYGRAPAQHRRSPLWVRWGVGSTLAQALLWGLLPAIVPEPGSAEAEAVLHIVLAGVAMGAAVHLSTYFQLLAAYVAGVMLPLLLRDLLMDSAHHHLLATLALMTGLYTLMIGRNQSRVLAEILAQRQRNEQLVAALQAENERSEAALRTAEAAGAARTRFFAAANHDLRQPLHALALLTQTLRAQQPPEPVQAVAAHMQACVEGMALVVDELLDLTRLDGGAAAPQWAVFRVDEFVQDCARPFEAMAEAKGLAFALSCDAVLVRSDRALLARVLSNLVANAIRYTRAGAVKISARVEGAGDGPGPGAAVRLQVEDTGIGIAAEHLPRIFEEFYQVGNPARDRRQGLGLGLATVKRLSDLLGLAVTVRSQVGQGSRFEFTLHRAPGDAAATPRAPAAMPSAPPPMQSLQLPPRVLAIEDDADSRDALLGLLHAWGWDVRAVQDAEGGLAALAAGFEPDAIVADLRLAQGGDGVHAVRALHGALGRPVPAVIATGDAGSPALAAARAAGLAVMVKPIRPVQLRAFLGQALALRPSAAPGSGSPRSAGSTH